MMVMLLEIQLGILVSGPRHAQSSPFLLAQAPSSNRHQLNCAVMLSPPRIPASWVVEIRLGAEVEDQRPLQRLRWREQAQLSSHHSAAG